MAGIDRSIHTYGILDVVFIAFALRDRLFSTRGLRFGFGLGVKYVRQQCQFKVGSCTCVCLCVLAGEEGAKRLGPARVNIVEWTCARLMRVH